MQVTRRVLVLRSGRRVAVVRWGLVLGSGFHHLMVSLRMEANVTQEAMLASWSRADMMSSEEGRRLGRRDRERLRKS